MTSQEPTPRPFQEPTATGEPRVDALARLVAVLDRLRAPDGCPWDRKQTVASMAPTIIEEAYELLEAIEDGDERGTVEESGDLLLVVTLICRIAQDEGRFDLEQVANGVADKLLRRHPHVFSDVAADSAAEALESWEAVKARERRGREADASALAGVPRGLPALQRASRLGQKAVSAGFKWESPEGAMAKVAEEAAELSEAFAGLAAAASDPAAKEAARGRVGEELGDLFLAGAQLAAYLGLDAERLAREASARFETRFRELEKRLGGDLGRRSLAELMEAWEQAKRNSSQES